MRNTTIKSTKSISRMLISLKKKAKQNEDMYQTLVEQELRKFLDKTKQRLATKIVFPDGEFIIYNDIAELYNFARTSDYKTVADHWEMEIPPDYFNGIPHRLMAESEHYFCKYEKVFRNKNIDIVQAAGNFMIKTITTEKPEDITTVMILRARYLSWDDEFYICTLLDRKITVADDTENEEILLGTYHIPEKQWNKIPGIKNKNSVIWENIIYNTTKQWKGEETWNT